MTHKAVDAVVWGPNKYNENLTFIDVFLAGPHGTSVLVGVVVSPPALTPHTMGCRVSPSQGVVCGSRAWSSPPTGVTLGQSHPTSGSQLPLRLTANREKSLHCGVS